MYPWFRLWCEKGEESKFYFLLENIIQSKWNLSDYAVEFIKCVFDFAIFKMCRIPCDIMSLSFSVRFIPDSLSSEIFSAQSLFSQFFASGTIVLTCHNFYSVSRERERRRGSKKIIGIPMGMPKSITINDLFIFIFVWHKIGGNNMLYQMWSIRSMWHDLFHFINHDLNNHNTKSCVPCIHVD